MSFIFFLLYVLVAAGVAGVYHQRWYARYLLLQERKESWQRRRCEDWWEKNGPIVAFSVFWIVALPAFYVWRVGRYLGRPATKKMLDDNGIEIVKR